MKKIYKLTIDVSTSTDESRSGHAFYADHDIAIKEFEHWKDAITKRWNLKTEEGKYNDDKGGWEITTTKYGYDRYYRCRFRSKDRNTWALVNVNLYEDTLLEGDEFLTELCGAICKDDTNTYYARITDCSILSTDKSFKITDMINIKTKEMVSELDPNTHFNRVTLEEERNYYKILEQINKT